MTQQNNRPTDRAHSMEALRSLGLPGSDIFMAELVLASEMAWADGVLQPNEKAMLHAYCEELVEQLNRQAGARLFTMRHALRTLQRGLARRLRPHERELILECVRSISTGSSGAGLRRRAVQWCEAVAALDGSPVWDAGELFWLQRLRAALEVA